MRDFLTVMGFAFLCLLALLAVSLLWCGLKELADVLKRRWIIKHRFDKPPTAQCYCKDCVRHSDETHRCHKFDGWYPADNWFCWDADPRKEIKK